MPAELPIACSLSAAELPVRQAQMAALGRDAMTHASVEGTHAEVRFAAGAGVRDRVERIMVAERACCAFLTMRVSDAPDTVVLSIDAPDGAERVLRELVDAFRAQPWWRDGRGSEPRRRPDAALAGPGRSSCSAVRWGRR